MRFRTVPSDSPCRRHLRHQRVDVPPLESLRPQALVAEAVQGLRSLGENVAPTAARAVRALPVFLQQAQQVEVQLPHRLFPATNPAFQSRAAPEAASPSKLGRATTTVNHGVLAETVSA
ncbi:MAG: hypothetical protein OXG71_11700 [Rhodospirillales bacterium]|nr:hypothetical protein [Rhodospirillales bacterium]